MTTIYVDTNGNAMVGERLNCPKASGPDPVGGLSGMRDLLTNFNQKQLRDLGIPDLKGLRDLTFKI